MSGFRTRVLVRTLVGAALVVALWTSATAPVPEDLPTMAFKQVALYRLEIALAAFYGSLLIITPAFSGLTWGRLPIEISTRGAKFADRAIHSAELDEEEIRKLEIGLSRLADGLSEAKMDIHQLKMGGDSR